MAQTRIYIAIETFFPLVGGAERQALLLARYLHEEGREVTIITFHHDPLWPAYDLQDDIPVVRVARTALRWHGSSSVLFRRLCYMLALLVLIWRLWTWRTNFDALHSFQLSPFALPALLICWLTGKPLVVSARCDAAHALPEQSPAGQQQRGVSLLDGLPRLNAPALSLVNRMLGAMPTCITVLSKTMDEHLRQSGLQPGRTCCIPNGVDIRHFCPASPSKRVSLLVVCVARLHYQKGIDILLHAWQRVVKTLPEARLHLIGDGPLCVELQSLASSLGVSDSVDFAGLCPDVVSHWQSASLAVLPSRWEGMPNALLEAMSCGVPCVATRVSGSEDLLNLSGGGLLVRPDDSCELAQALLMLLLHPEQAHKYGLLARQYVVNYHALPALLERYPVLYDEMLALAASLANQKKHSPVTDLTSSLSACFYRQRKRVRCQTQKMVREWEPEQDATD